VQKIEDRLASLGMPEYAHRFSENHIDFDGSGPQGFRRIITRSPPQNNTRFLPSLSLHFGFLAQSVVANFGLNLGTFKFSN